MDWQIDKCKYTSQMTGRTDIYIMVCITRKWLTFIWSQSAIGLPITLRIFGIEAMCLVLRRLEILSAVDVEDKSWQCVKAAAISPHSPSSNPLPELLDRNWLETMCSNLSPVDPRFITMHYAGGGCCCWILTIMSKRWIAVTPATPPSSPTRNLLPEDEVARNSVQNSIATKYFCVRDVSEKSNWESRTTIILQRPVQRPLDPYMAVSNRLQSLLHLSSSLAGRNVVLKTLKYDEYVIPVTPPNPQKQRNRQQRYQMDRLPFPRIIFTLRRELHLHRATWAPIFLHFGVDSSQQWDNNTTRWHHRSLTNQLLEMWKQSLQSLKHSRNCTKRSLLYWPANDLLLTGRPKCCTQNSNARGCAKV